MQFKSNLLCDCSQGTALSLLSFQVVAKHLFTYSPVSNRVWLTLSGPWLREIREQEGHGKMEKSESWPEIVAGQSYKVSAYWYCFLPYLWYSLPLSLSFLYMCVCVYRFMYVSARVCMCTCKCRSEDNRGYHSSQCVSTLGLFDCCFRQFISDLVLTR